MAAAVGATRQGLGRATPLPSRCHFRKLARRRQRLTHGTDPRVRRRGRRLVPRADDRGAHVHGREDVHGGAAVAVDGGEDGGGCCVGREQVLARGGIEGHDGGFAAVGPVAWDGAGRWGGERRRVEVRDVYGRPCGWEGLGWEGGKVRRGYQQCAGRRVGRL